MEKTVTLGVKPTQVGIWIRKRWLSQEGKIPGWKKGQENPNNAGLKRKPMPGDAHRINTVPGRN